VLGSATKAMYKHFIMSRVGLVVPVALWLTSAYNAYSAYHAWQSDDGWRHPICTNFIISVIGFQSMLTMYSAIEFLHSDIVKECIDGILADTNDSEEMFVLGDHKYMHRFQACCAPVDAPSPRAKVCKRHPLAQSITSSADLFNRGHMWDMPSKMDCNGVVKVILRVANFAFWVIASMLLSKTLSGSVIDMVVLPFAVLQLAVMSDCYMFVFPLAEGLTEGMLKSFIQKIKTQDDTGRERWWRLSDDYRDIVCMLEKLWKEAVLPYGFHHAGTLFLMCATQVSCLVAVYNHHVPTASICGPFAIWLALSQVLAASRLARLTALGVASKSTEESIIAAAANKFGLTHLQTPEERDAHSQFIQHLQMSPCGVQLVVVIDWNFVGSFSIPSMTCIYSVVTYLAGYYHGQKGL